MSYKFKFKTQTTTNFKLNSQKLTKLQLHTSIQVNIQIPG